MPMTKDQILAEAMALDANDRRALIEDLRQVADEGELTPDQLAELRRRVDAVRRGEAKLLPGDQVMKELHDHLSRR